MKDPQAKFLAIKSVVGGLPPPNRLVCLVNSVYCDRALLRAISELAGAVYAHSDVNLMTPENLSIVLGPCLLWSENDLDPMQAGLEAFKAIADAGHINGIILCIIENRAEIFKPKK